jgi:hypothetical protein
MTADAPRTPLKPSTAVSLRKTGRVAPRVNPAESKPIQQTERAFQASVIRYAELMGWTCHHHYDSRRSSPGLPDLLLVRRPRVVWAELKSERGRLTPDQRAWIEELRACGQEVFLWRPSDWEKIERVLR